MGILVDTSVWSLALRRNVPAVSSEVDKLRRAIDSGEDIYSTGIILQELLQGLVGASAHEAIVERFASIPMLRHLILETADQIEAAELRNRFRRKVEHAGTIDALIAQLSLRFKLSLLSIDKDFKHMSKVVKLTFAK